MLGMQSSETGTEQEGLHLTSQQGDIQLDVPQHDHYRESAQIVRAPPWKQSSAQAHRR